MKSPKTIKDLFCFPGFTANAKLTGVFGDKHARVVTLKRRKKQPVVRIAAIVVTDGMTNRLSASEILRWPVIECLWSLNNGGFIAQGAKACI